MICWRISKFEDLDGLGGLRAGGRWHDKGVPIVYMADHPASAMLETLVHLEGGIDELPNDFQLLEIVVPDSLPTPAVPQSIADNITTPRLGQMSKSFGMDWLSDKTTPILRVPSAIVPNAYNWLLNPLHPDAAQCFVHAVYQAKWDPRFREKAAD